MDFYVCPICGNVIVYNTASGVAVECCGQPMEKLEANVKEAAVEKHLPVVEREGEKVLVKIGSLPHPMEDVHYIEWIVLETKRGHQYVPLQPGMAPEAHFVLAGGDEIVAAYAYCNIHGLWKTSA